MNLSKIPRAVTNYIISRIKGRVYAIDPSMPLKSLIAVYQVRAAMLLRSFLKYPFTQKNHRPLFLGRNARLAHRHKINFGSGCIVGDNVCIDGLSLQGVRFGKNVTIPDHTFIRCTGVISNLGVGLSVGDNTGFGHFNFINAQGGVAIGNDVIIGPHVKILSENHLFSDGTRLIREQGVSRKGIKIHDNVWIGAGVTILDGVTIHTGAVLAAGTVVTKDVPAHCIAGGVPARVIGRTVSETNNP